MTTEKKRRSNTPFERKWGMHISDIAAAEGLTPDAIRMRVHNFGTPYQRRKRPTLIEIMTGKTRYELARELDAHPLTVLNRLKEFGDHTRISNDNYGHRLHFKTAEVNWKDRLIDPSHKGWLMPQHPEYGTWRYKYIAQYCKFSQEANEDGEEQDND
jgi:hypothetical protein